MADYSFLERIERRKFLQVLSFTGISGLIYPKTAISSILNSALSRVVIVYDKNATTGNTINTTPVKAMVESGLKTLTGKNTLDEAWKTILPDIKNTSKIAIKVNCINSSLSTHPEVALAVANSLTQMSFNGAPFPENNIIIYDRTTGELQSAKYKINTSSTGVRCFATNSTGIGYSSQTYNVYGSNQKISRIVTELTDYLINIAVLKNHTGAGITACMKNHYGTCNDPDSLHGSYCDNYIPILNQVQPIFTKQKIGICDALYGIKTGGPGGPPQFIANKILFSQDIVAIDYCCRKILSDNGSNTIRYATYVDNASTKYNLGTNDPAKMEIIDVLNPSLGVSDKTNMPNEYILEQNYPNPFNNSTIIRFSIPEENHVSLKIYDTNGKEVFNLVEKRLNQGLHEVLWNGTNNYSAGVASGVYICELKTAGYKKAIIMQLLK